MEEEVTLILGIFTVGDIITIVFAVLGCLGSLFGWLMSCGNRRKAKESEEQAKLYAQNADTANIEVQRYLGTLNKQVDENNSFIAEVEKVKTHLANIYKKYKENPFSNTATDMYGIAHIIEHMYSGDCDKTMLLKILRCLEKDQMIIEMAVDNLPEFYLFRIIRDF